jgi:hypothetical protein
MTNRTIKRLTTVNALAWVFLGALVVLLNVTPAQAGHPRQATSPAVGSWIGQVHGAQYEDHLYQFHADGTMEGTNPQRVQEKPDGTGVNDSLAMGSWHMERGKVVGVFLELNANQTTHKPAPNLTVRFTLEVHGDHLTGTAKVWVGDEQVPDASFDLRRIA